MALPGLATLQQISLSIQIVKMLRKVAEVGVTRLVNCYIEDNDNQQ